jgi:hypothetical protein
MTSATRYDLVSAIFRCADGAADAARAGWEQAPSRTWCAHMNNAAAAFILAALELTPVPPWPADGLGFQTALGTSQWRREIMTTEPLAQRIQLLIKFTCKTNQMGDPGVVCVCMMCGCGFILEQQFVA